MVVGCTGVGGTKRLRIGGGSRTEKGWGGIGNDPSHFGTCESHVVSIHSPNNPALQAHKHRFLSLFLSCPSCGPLLLDIRKNGTLKDIFEEEELGDFGLFFRNRDS